MERTRRQVDPNHPSCHDSALTEILWCPTDHKKEYQATQTELHAPKALKSVLPKHAHLIPGSNLVRRTFANRSKTPEPGSESPANQHGDQAVHSKAEEADRADTPTKQALRHGRPQEYTQARSKLKLASGSPHSPFCESTADRVLDSSAFEYYRYLGMLKSYRVLNRTGFAKVSCGGSSEASQ